jgi:hypothetical protein
VSYKFHPVGKPSSDKCSIILNFLLKLGNLQFPTLFSFFLLVVAIPGSDDMLTTFSRAVGITKNAQV